MPSLLPAPDVDAFTSWARRKAALFLFPLAVLLAGALMARVEAATLIATNTNDSGPGSLRQAIADAHDGETIEFDPALNGHSISLTSGELVIDKNISINGPAPQLLTVARSQTELEFGIVHITPGRTVAIQGLTISGGSAPK